MIAGPKPSTERHLSYLVGESGAQTVLILHGQHSSRDRCVVS